MLKASTVCVRSTYMYIHVLYVIHKIKNAKVYEEGCMLEFEFLVFLIFFVLRKVAWTDMNLKMCEREK